MGRFGGLHSKKEFSLILRAGIKGLNLAQADKAAIEPRLPAGFLGSKAGRATTPKDVEIVSEHGGCS